MWNKGQPIGWMASWNPFTNEIPWKTITDHPLYNYQGKVANVWLFVYTNNTHVGFMI